tara:strand:- start:554 stop:3088 length:2535 start_codon:yes stop_codon:yes gene_type:complete
MQTYFFPLRAVVQESLLQGDVPLWDPYRFMGAPLLANPQASVFYPLSLMLLFIGADRFFVVTNLIHVLVSGIGMVAYMRTIYGISWKGCVVAAITFAFSGYMAAHFSHPNQLAVIAWMPFLLVATERLVSSSRWMAMLCISILAALQILAGHPQQTYVAWCLAALHLGMMVIRTYRTDGYKVLLVCRIVAMWSAGILFGAAIAAVNLLPTMGLVQDSVRSNGMTLGQSGSFSLTPDYLAGALLPSFTAVPVTQEFLSFVGFTGIWLASIALVCNQHRGRVAFMLVLAVIGWSLATGPTLPLFRILFEYFPGFDLFRVPARWLLFSTFALSVLAGVGVDGVLGMRNGIFRKSACNWFLVLAVSFVAVLIAVSSYSNQEISVSQVLVWSAVGFSTLALIIVSIHWKSIPWLIIPLMLFAELFAASRPLELGNPIAAEAYEENEYLSSLIPAEMSGPRVLSLADTVFEINDEDRAEYASLYREDLGFESFEQFLIAIKYRDVLSPNLSGAYSIPSADGYDGGLLPLRSFVDYKSRWINDAKDNPDALIRHQQNGFPSVDMLRGLGVGYVIADRINDVEVEGVFLDKEAERELRGPIRLKFVLPSEVIVDKVFALGQIEVSNPALNLKVSFGQWTGSFMKSDSGYFVTDGLMPMSKTNQITVSVPEGMTVNLKALTVMSDDKQYPIPLMNLDESSDGTLLTGPYAWLDAWHHVKIYRLREMPQRAELRFDKYAGQDTAASGLARILDYRRDYMKIGYASPSSATLVIYDANYPGWSANVNGVPVQVTTIDGFLRGIEVPAGSGVVDLQFDSPFFRYGSVISIVACFCWLTGLLAILRRKFSTERQNVL